MYSSLTSLSSDLRIQYAKNIETRAQWNQEEDCWTVSKLELAGNKMRAKKNKHASKDSHPRSYLSALEMDMSQLPGGGQETDFDGRGGNSPSSLWEFPFLLLTTVTNVNLFPSFLPLTKDYQAPFVSTLHPSPLFSLINNISYLPTLPSHPSLPQVQATMVVMTAKTFISLTLVYQHPICNMR